MSNKTEVKHRAKIDILGWIMQNPNIRSKDWSSSFGDKAVVGDLVALSSAPLTKWYLSWVIEVKNDQYGGQYLLESIEDGSLCWWGNVGVHYFNREDVKELGYSWRWSDEQFKFRDKWQKACKKGYMLRPLPPVFDDNGVIIRMRARWGKSFHHTKRIEKWKTITIKELRAFHDKCEEIRGKEGNHHNDN